MCPEHLEALPIVHIVFILVTVESTANGLGKQVLWSAFLSFPHGSQFDTSSGKRFFVPNNIDYDDLLI